MRRNSFLTIMFALIPGAGEMFLGYMKKGMSSMMIFFGILGIGTFFRLEFVLFALPVVWFYSFFTTLNLHGLIIKGMPLPRDEFVISGFNLKGNFEGIFSKKNNFYIGYGLVVIGGLSLISFISEPIIDVLYRYWPSVGDLLRDLTYRLPALLVSVAIVLLGVKLIKGKSEKEQEQAKMEDENINMYGSQQVMMIQDEESKNEQQ